MTIKDKETTIPVVVPSKKAIAEFKAKMDTMLKVNLLGNAITSTVSEDKIFDFLEDCANVFSTGALLTTSLFDWTTGKNREYNGNNVPSRYGHKVHWPYPGGMSGITILIGGSGAGKSEYMWRILQPDVVIRYGEAYEKWDRKPNVVHANSIITAIELAIGYSLLGLTVGIDSLRYAAYTIEGPAGPKGIVTTLFTMLTDLSNLVAVSGANIPVVFNPMVSDDAMEILYDNGGGSCAGVVQIRDKVAIKGLMRTDVGRDDISNAHADTSAFAPLQTVDDSGHGGQFDTYKEHDEVIRISHRDSHPPERTDDSVHGTDFDLTSTSPKKTKL
jgi:hypothetical protein